MIEQDRHITKIRLTLKDTINEILEYRFVTMDEIRKYRPVHNRESSVLSDKSDVTLDVSQSSDVYYDAQEELSASLRSGLRFDSDVTCTSIQENEILATPDGPIFMTPFQLPPFSPAGSDDVRLSMDIFDSERIRVMNSALDQVSSLLTKLDTAEQYYASGKMFRLDHPAVGNTEFQARVKSLCMW